jgi:HEAT repeats
MKMSDGGRHEISGDWVIAKACEVVEECENLGAVKDVVTKMVAVDDVRGLTRLLMNKGWRVRVEGIRGLQEIGDVRVVEPLIKALKDEDERVRVEACRALRTIARNLTRIGSVH